MKDYKRLTKKDLGYWNVDLGDYEEMYYRLCELENKIEDGTLIELPCQVGDTVYYVFANDIKICKVVKITLYDENKAMLDFKLKNDEHLTFSRFECVFGDRLFKTKAEAEKRLEELRGKK